jgi:L-lactate dehydrogenase complex protein LldG
MSARDVVLGKIRRALGVTGREIARNAAVDDRLRRAPRGVIPARGQLPGAERIALFSTMATAVGATVERLPRPDDVPGAIVTYLRARNLPTSIVAGSDPLLAGLPWGKTPVAVRHGAAEDRDVVGLSRAIAGVAESGTLVMASGKYNPTTINFLPETHLVVIHAEDIVGDYESVWARVRTAIGKGQMPRTLNLITGPSRSADIEQKIMLGAHGPRRLHIMIIGNPG